MSKYRTLRHYRYSNFILIMRNKTYLLFFGVFLLSISTSAQKIGILDREKATKIDRLLQLYDSFGDISGAVLVAKDGKIIYESAFGAANREWEIKNTVDTKFRIGSLTKQFTAVIILQLVDEGKLNLKGTISDYLSDYRKDIGQAVTIHQLLTHTSGIPDYIQHPDFVKTIVRNSIPVSVLVNKYCSDDLEFKPGEKFQYNNSGYIILGAIIEAVTGKSYEKNLTERILIPLEMENTGYDSPYSILPKRAMGYQKSGFEYTNAMFIDMSIPYAAGGMYSTVGDLFKWERALKNNRLVSKKLHKKMFKPQENNYGYGWYIKDTPVNVNGTETLKAYCIGSIYGFKSSISRLIEDNHTIIVLCNNNAVPIEEIDERLQLTLYGMPYDLPRKSIMTMMMQSIRLQGIETAISEYKKLKIAQKEIWTFRVNELDDLGKELLKLKKIEAAILIFQLNVEEFPESYVAYHSLAEAYKKNGDKEKAIENFEKSLKLNPENTTAKIKLRGLKIDD